MKYILFFATIFASLYCSAQLDMLSPGVSSERHTSEIFVEANGSYKLTETTHLKALDDTGRLRLTSYIITFDAKIENVEVISAGVEQDGVKTPVDLKNIKRINTGATENGLSTLNQLVIPFPGVKTGGTIWYELKRNIKPEGVAGLFFERFMFGFIQREGNAKTTIKSAVPLYTSIHDPDKKIIYTADTTKIPHVYVIEIKEPILAASVSDLKAKGFEEAFEKVPRIDISSQNDWSKLSYIYARHYNLTQAELSNPVLKKITTPLALLPDNSKKAEGILAWAIENMTYSRRGQHPLSGHRPQSLDAILSGRAGDCKDFAKLFLAAAKNLNIEAQGVLVHVGDAGPFEEPIDKKSPLPGDYFNHIVVRFRDGANWKTIDPGRRVTDVSRIPYFLLNSMALNIPTLKAPYKITTYDTEYSYVNLVNNFTRRPDGVLIGDSTMDVDGEFGNYLRDIYFSVDKEKFKDVLKAYLPVGKPSNFKFEEIIPITRSANSLKFKMSYNAAADGNDGKQHIYPPITGMEFLKDRTYSSISTPHFPGKFKQTSNFPGMFAIDEVKNDCYVLGPISDIKRRVYNRGSGVVIEDVLQNKDTSNYKPVSKKEKEIHSRHRSMVSDCMFESALNLVVKNPMSKDQKTFESTINLAKEYSDGDGSDHSSEKDMRDFREIEYRLEKKPNDYYLTRKKAGSLGAMGYLYGRVRVGHYPEAAISTLKGLLGKTPYDAIIYARIGMFHDSNKNQAGAKEYLTKSESLNKPSLEYYQLKGLVEWDENKHDQAIESFKQGLKLPENQFFVREGILSEIATLYCRHYKDCKQSMVYHDELIKLNPKDPWIYHNAAITLYKIPDYQKTIEMERKALKLMKFGAAKQTLKDALKFEAWNMMGKTGRVKADYDQIEKLLVEAYGYDSKDAHLLYKLAFYFALRAEFEKNPSHLSTSRNYIEELKTEDISYYNSNPELEKVFSKIESELKASAGNVAPASRIPASK